MAAQNPVRRLRTAPGEHYVTLTPFLDETTHHLTTDDDLAIIDQHPHHPDLIIALPAHAPNWAHTRQIRRHDCGYILNIPTPILNQRNLDDTHNLEYAELENTYATLTF